VALSWPATLWFYLKVIIWPLRPMAFGDSVPVEKFSAAGVLLPALAVLLAVVVLASGVVWAYRKATDRLSPKESLGVHRALILGTLMLVLPILLALNLNTLVPGDFLHGRYGYLPVAGLSLLLATAWRLLDRFTLPLLGTAAVIAIAFAVLTVQQEPMWNDDLSVYTMAHEIAPRNQPVRLSLTRARVQYGMRLDDQGHCDEAVPILEEATRDYPQDWYAWAGLGECFFKLNQLDKAEQSLRRASELSKNPRVTDQWRMLRERMGLGTATPKN
jgi:hypothetical protein